MVVSSLKLQNHFQIFLSIYCNDSFKPLTFTFGNSQLVTAKTRCYVTRYKAGFCTIVSIGSQSIYKKYSKLFRFHNQYQDHDMISQILYYTKSTNQIFFCLIGSSDGVTNFPHQIHSLKSDEKKTSWKKLVKKYCEPKNVKVQLKFY